MYNQGLSYRGLFFSRNGTQRRVIRRTRIVGEDSQRRRVRRDPEGQVGSGRQGGGQRVVEGHAQKQGSGSEGCSKQVVLVVERG